MPSFMLSLWFLGFVFHATVFTVITFSAIVGAFRDSDCLISCLTQRLQLDGSPLKCVCLGQQVLVSTPSVDRPPLCMYLRLFLTEDEQRRQEKMGRGVHEHS